MTTTFTYTNRSFFTEIPSSSNNMFFTFFQLELITFIFHWEWSKLTKTRKRNMLFQALPSLTLYMMVRSVMLMLGTVFAMSGYLYLRLAISMPNCVPQSPT